LHYIGIRGIRYFGLYGWENGAGAMLPSRSTAILQRVRRQLEQLSPRLSNAWIEDKSSSLSVHLLDVPAPLQTQIRRKLRAWLKPFRNSLRAEANLRDVEILPRSSWERAQPSAACWPSQRSAALYPFTLGTISQTNPASPPCPGASQSTSASRVGPPRATPSARLPK
jgi:trehalose-6-phosphatase